MLRFAENPDKIFTKILELSIINALDSIKDLSDISEFKIFFPNASRNFNQRTANKTLKKLFKYNKSPWLWQLNDYHYVLLYDTLKLFCDLGNDLTGDTNEPVLTLSGYGIWEIDFEFLIEHYFWDEDFLIDQEIMLKLTGKGKAQLGFNKETFGITMGLSPHPDELKIKLCKRGNFIPEYPDSLYFNKKSRKYPDYQEE